MKKERMKERKKEKERERKQAVGEVESVRKREERVAESEYRWEDKIGTGSREVIERK